MAFPRLTKQACETTWRHTSSDLHQKTMESPPSSWDKLTFRIYHNMCWKWTTVTILNLKFWSSLAAQLWKKKKFSDPTTRELWFDESNFSSRTSLCWDFVTIQQVYKLTKRLIIWMGFAFNPRIGPKRRKIKKNRWTIVYLFTNLNYISVRLSKWAYGFMGWCRDSFMQYVLVFIM